eukprot:436625_1
MAEQKKDESKQDMHQIPNQQRNPIEVYRLLSKAHTYRSNSNAWTFIDGLQKYIKVDDNSVDIIITVHGHTDPQNKQSTRITFGIFVDGELTGINGYEKGQWGDREGTALSYSPNVIPIISIASIRLNKREQHYNIDCRIRNGDNSGKTSGVASPAMLIQVFKPHPIIKWNDIDLDDDKMYFNKNLEYKIEIKGKTTAFAMTIDKENLWFFYADLKAGMKCIKYTDKRCFDNKYFVTKIQCSARK